MQDTKSLYIHNPTNFLQSYPKWYNIARTGDRCMRRGGALSTREGEVLYLQQKRRCSIYNRRGGALSTTEEEVLYLQQKRRCSIYNRRGGALSTTEEEVLYLQQKRWCSIYNRRGGALSTTEEEVLYLQQKRRCSIYNRRGGALSTTEREVLYLQQKRRCSIYNRRGGAPSTTEEEVLYLQQKRRCSIYNRRGSALYTAEEEVLYLQQKRYFIYNRRGGALSTTEEEVLYLQQKMRCSIYCRRRGALSRQPIQSEYDVRCVLQQLHTWSAISTNVFCISATKIWIWFISATWNLCGINFKPQILIPILTYTPSQYTYMYAYFKGIRHVSEICYHGPFLLTWFNFNPSMDK